MSCSRSPPNTSGNNSMTAMYASLNFPVRSGNRPRSSQVNSNSPRSRREFLIQILDAALEIANDAEVDMEVLNGDNRSNDDGTSHNDDKSLLDDIFKNIRKQ